MWIVVFLLASKHSVWSQLYTTVTGNVSFVSDAPLELIKASSNQMQGALDVLQKTFAFKVYIKSFDGFNSPVQRTHFYENYMEVSDFPLATFKGKILEDIVQGNHDYRAKGLLDIHGTVVERIINIQLDIQPDQVTYDAEFEVPIANHGIEIPRIVYQKIAETISVSVSGTLYQRSNE